MPALRKLIIAGILAAAASAALGQSAAPPQVDTVTDTIYDTVRLSDTTDRYYQLAEKAIEHRMTVITVILTFIGLLLAAFSVALVVEGRRASRKIEQDLQIARHKVDCAVLRAEKEALEARNLIAGDLDELKVSTKAELDKVRAETEAAIREIGRLKEESQRHVLETKQKAEKEISDIGEKTKDAIRQLAEIEARITELGRMTEKPVRKAQEKAAATPGLDVEEKLKLIETADASEAVEQYEKLVDDMKREGLSGSMIPSAIRRNMGYHYFLLDRYEKALPELLAYLESSPDDEWALFMAGLSFGRLKKHEDAMRYWERIVSLNATDATALYNWAASLVRLYDATGDKSALHQAVEKCNRALELAPDRKDYYYNLACAQALLGKKEEMLSALKEAITFDPKHKKMAREDEDFKAYWDDPDFRALTDEEPGEDEGKKPE